MIAAALLSLAGFGVVLAIIQSVTLRAQLSQAEPEPQSFPFVSVLKPLCGVDDDLWRNLCSFARISYPRFQILLGVKDPLDPAYAIALRAAKHWPHLVQVVIQRGAAGHNPKVNQLITLAAAARGEVLVVSDSNVRVRPDYLRGIVALLEDTKVGLVSHAVAGIGERSLGALFDNFTMCGSIAPGVVSVKRIAGKDLVVGKSMALRRRDLRTMGGFERLKDVLAEDFLAGRIVVRELGKKVALGSRPVFNVARSQTVAAFFCRYLRWSVMQRKVVGNLAYAAQVVLSPVALATAALFASPDRRMARALAVVSLARMILLESSSRALRGRGFGRLCILVPFADLLIACAWAGGLVRSEINWRGNQLLVREGTQLEPVVTAAVPSAGRDPAGALPAR